MATVYTQNIAGKGLENYIVLLILHLILNPFGIKKKKFLPGE